MSDVCLRAVFELALPPGQKYMLIALAHHAGDDGRVQMSSMDFAMWTGYSPSQTERILRQLLGEGLVQTEGETQRASNEARRYVLCLGREGGGA